MLSTVVYAMFWCGIIMSIPPPALYAEVLATLLPMHAQTKSSFLQQYSARVHACDGKLLSTRQDASKISSPVVRHATSPQAYSSSDTASIVRVVMYTALGSIEVELYRRAAPATVQNFLEYVAGGYYTGSMFYRTVRKDNQPDKPDSIKIEAIQATISSLYAQHAMPPILMETTQQTGIRHLDGTISMARDEPNTAQYEFFICIGDQPQLDFGGHRNPDGYGFAAFGRVVKGMDVVRKIHQSPSAGQALTPPIMIFSIQRKA
ncbi:MAG: peptidylprolyl isomerase [Candidatus Kapabacteria bacterium]|nr:peptidylprolyl isomerase [Candidatus Kapabacteria bacterium]